MRVLHKPCQLSLHVAPCICAVCHRLTWPSYNAAIRACSRRAVRSACAWFAVGSGLELGGLVGLAPGLGLGVGARFGVGIRVRVRITALGFRTELGLGIGLGLGSGAHRARCGAPFGAVAEEELGSVREHRLQGGADVVQGLGALGVRVTEEQTLRRP